MITFFRQKLVWKKQFIHIEDAIQFGDQSLVFLDKVGGHFLFNFPIPKQLETSLYDLKFPTPIISSSFKSDMSVLSIWLKLGLGGVTLKTVMMNKRCGNLIPRIREIKFDGQLSLVNAMGLPGPGVVKLMADFETSDLMNWNRPIGFSIGGNTCDEYIQVFQILSKSLERFKTLQRFFEFNLSCPNVPGEKNFSLTTTFLDELLTRIRKESHAVIGVKLSPDFDNKHLKAIAQLVKKHVRVFINVGNTQFMTCQKLGLSDHDISIGGGGLSGPPLYERTLEMTKCLAPYGLPIIATGGVSQAWQVRELLANGASLVGMATSIVQNHYCIPTINNELID